MQNILKLGTTAMLSTGALAVGVLPETGPGMGVAGVLDTVTMTLCASANLAPTVIPELPSPCGVCSGLKRKTPEDASDESDGSDSSLSSHISDADYGSDPCPDEIRRTRKWRRDNAYIPSDMPHIVNVARAYATDKALAEYDLV